MLEIRWRLCIVYGEPSFNYKQKLPLYTAEWSFSLAKIVHENKISRKVMVADGGGGVFAYRIPPLTFLLTTPTDRSSPKLDLLRNTDVLTAPESKCMLCTAQLGLPVLKTFAGVQKTPFQLAHKAPMITDQHTAGGSVSQLRRKPRISTVIVLIRKMIYSWWKSLITPDLPFWKKFVHYTINRH